MHLNTLCGGFHRWIRKSNTKPTVSPLQLHAVAAMTVTGPVPSVPTCQVEAFVHHPEGNIGILHASAARHTGLGGRQVVSSILHAAWLRLN